MNYAFRATMVRKETLLGRLRNIPLFDALSGDQLEKLADAAGPRTVRSREILYEQGDPARSCFLVLDGTLRFTIMLRKRNATSGLATTDDVFGLECLQRGGPRRETAIAVGQAELLEIEGGFFRGFVLENPRFQLQLLNDVVSRYHEKSSHAVHTGHYDAEQKLAAYLIGNCGNVSAGGCREHAAISQADLADYLSLTPETLCRKVGQFRKRGWIAGRGNEYIIKQPAALRELLDQ